MFKTITMFALVSIFATGCGIGDWLESKGTEIISDAIAENVSTQEEIEALATEMCEESTLLLEFRMDLECGVALQQSQVQFDEALLTKDRECDDAIDALEDAHAADLEEGCDDAVEEAREESRETITAIGEQLRSCYSGTGSRAAIMCTGLGLEHNALEDDWNDSLCANYDASDPERPLACAELELDVDALERTYVRLFCEAETGMALPRFIERELD